MSRPTYLTPSTTECISRTGLSPAVVYVSKYFRYTIDYHVKAGPVSLATTSGISVDFFSSSYLDGSVRSVCFATPMYSGWDTGLDQWVAPFGDLRIKACLSAPRSLSQTTTSFIACNRQGIRRMHLFA